MGARVGSRGLFQQPDPKRQPGPGIGRAPLNLSRITRRAGSPAGPSSCSGHRSTPAQAATSASVISNVARIGTSGRKTTTATATTAATMPTQKLAAMAIDTES